MTKVKICGLSTPEAVATAVKAGADYIGFVFAKSNRQVSLEQAHELAKGVTGQTKTVGVFVSPSLKELEEAISQVPLDIVQIHGTFDEDLISKISVPVIRAIQISDGDSQVKSQAGYLLFDAPIAGYTLIYNSYGLMLTAHEPFKSVDATIRSGRDMQTNQVAKEVSQKRILVGDTDNGKRLRENIKDLKELIKAYRDGTIRQNQKN